MKLLNFWHLLFGPPKRATVELRKKRKVVSAQMADRVQGRQWWIDAGYEVID